jgi:hypothetical protein
VRKNKIVDVILQLLSSDKKYKTYAMVLTNDDRTSEYILERLAQSPDKDIKVKVARNLNTPSKAFYQLIRSCSTCRDVLSAIALNPMTPKYLLQKLLHHSDKRVRELTVYNPNLPKTILTNLCKSKETGLKFALINNPHITHSMLERLVKDDNEVVRGEAKEKLRQLQRRYLDEEIITSNR